MEDFLASIFDILCECLQKTFRVVGSLLILIGGIMGGESKSPEPEEEEKIVPVFKPHPWTPKKVIPSKGLEL